MSQFTKHVKGTLTFDGDTVEVTMRRLRRKDAMKLVPYMGEPDEDGNFVMQFSDQMQMMDVAADLLQKSDYVFELSGLNLNGHELKKTGENVSNQEDWDDMFENAYFMPLLSDMMSFLMSESFVKEETVKKSGEQPVDTSRGLTVTPGSTSADTP